VKLEEIKFIPRKKISKFSQTFVDTNPSKAIWLLFLDTNMSLE